MAAEDASYRTSTQYKYFSFTPEKLDSLRSSTNALAAGQVKTAIKRKRAARTQPSSTDTSDAERNGSRGVVHKDIDCLTAAEELRLVEYYCEVCILMAKTPSLEFPTHVVATAIQYLKRFYLSNSPMTYHPKVIMPGCLFLATKTEHHFTRAKDYGAALSANSKVKMTEDDVTAPEFTIIQGLRFCMDVRHPHRGLKGAHLELRAIAEGNAALLPAFTKTPQEVQTEMQKVAPVGKWPQTITGVLERIELAYFRATETLKTKALLTDAYFLYTPSQIWMAAFLLADEPLLIFYLSTKLDRPDASFLPLKAKVLATLGTCAELLRNGPEMKNDAVTARRKAAIQVDKKLYHCQNPDKVDLVGLNKAQKRDEATDGKLDESKAKRRKLEREASMKEDPFGPALVKGGASS